MSNTITQTLQALVLGTKTIDTLIKNIELLQSVDPKKWQQLEKKINAARILIEEVENEIKDIEEETNNIDIVELSVGLYKTI